MGQFSSNDIILKNYRIEKSIGQGAFGEVYLATHNELNGKRAIKVLLRDENGVSSSDYQDYRNRFRQESQLMEWFNHSNMIRVYDFQEENKTLYLIMEYAAGGSLQQLIDNNKRNGELFSVHQTQKIGLDIANGLAALHLKDVVHRDLKPSNILFNEAGVAKISDLGLAQIPGGSSIRSQISMPKSHPGTPLYMSPEQETTGGYLRPCSDVYALGLILFEMMTGRSYKMLPPGSTLRKLIPSAPGWLDDLLSRMLSENQKDRPWSGDDVARELKNGANNASTVIPTTPLQISVPEITSEEKYSDRKPVFTDPSTPVENDNAHQNTSEIIQPDNSSPALRQNQTKRTLIIIGAISTIVLCILFSSLIFPPGQESSDKNRTATANQVSMPPSSDGQSENTDVPTRIPSPTPLPTATRDPETCNQVSFVADATIPDGAYVAPGKGFKKTWILKNIGTCTWTKKYSLVYSMGDQMGGKSPTYLSYEVKPGQVVDLSLNLTAPSRYGNFGSYWLMKDDEGHLFGWGKNHDQRIWAKITTDK